MMASFFNLNKTILQYRNKCYNNTYNIEYKKEGNQNVQG